MIDCPTNAFRRAHRPPPRIALADWIEANIRIPGALSAEPGPMRLWPAQRGIVEAVEDPRCERISFLKAARIGATTLQSAITLHYVDNRPAPILTLQPRESDARSYAIELERLAESSPAIGTVLAQSKARRDTITKRNLPGGAITFSAAMSPANFRRIPAKVLFADEVSAYEMTDEGAPLALAEKRTQTFADRLIWAASTPGDEDTCEITRLYESSDKRIFEIPCPHCGAFFAPVWKDIIWNADQPETARMRCPHCESDIPESHKLHMVKAGRWRITEPDRTASGHFGFWQNALTSLAANATWAQLAKEFLESKDDPDLLKVFVTTILAEAWAAPGEAIDPDSLLSAREPFALDSLPPECLWITLGCDVGRDRLNIAFIGHCADDSALVLDYREIFGNPLEPDVWSELDSVLSARWKHPNGSLIGISAAGIDEGDGAVTKQVRDYCRGKLGRRIVPVKGADGDRPHIRESRTRRARLWIIGVDSGKNRLFAMIDNSNGPRKIRFSESLTSQYFDELTAERRITKRVRGRPKPAWIRIGNRRAEGLDATIYGIAVRGLITQAIETRQSELQAKAAPQSQSGRSSWIDNRPGRIAG